MLRLTSADGESTGEEEGRFILGTSTERRIGQRWVGSDRAALLENGDAFFPRVLQAIRNARREVLIETFILRDDKVGQALQAALHEAARRGARVALDGFGSLALPRAFVEPMTADGVAVRSYDPGPRVFGQQLNLLRRMHRKLVAIDGRLAFVGGINFCADQLLDFGPAAKQDYAVEVEGPIVAEVYRFMRLAIARDEGQAHRFQTFGRSPDMRRACGLEKLMEKRRCAAAGAHGTSAARSRERCSRGIT